MLRNCILVVVLAVVMGCNRVTDVTHLAWMRGRCLQTDRVMVLVGSEGDRVASRHLLLQADGVDVITQVPAGTKVKITAVRYERSFEYTRVVVLGNVGSYSNVGVTHLFSSEWAIEARRAADDSAIPPGPVLQSDIARWAACQ